MNSCKTKVSTGFTLIEVLIYIALFSLLMGSAFIVAFQLIDGSSRLSIKNTTQEEGGFVIRKIDWALTGVQTITTPTAGTTHNLKVTKYDGTKIEICKDASVIKIHEGTFGTCTDPDYLALTTENVEVSGLDFEFIPGSGSGPDGIKATATITKDSVNFPFSVTRYIRK